MTGDARITVTTKSEEGTIELAARLGPLLRPGDIVAISGELGAGKTRFVRGLAAGLGINPGRVHSPTFVLANVYEEEGAGARLAHIDAYRLTSGEDIEALGWDRLQAGGSIVVIEWPERLGGALSEHSRVYAVRMEHTGPAQRRITIVAPAGQNLEGLEWNG